MGTLALTDAGLTVPTEQEVIDGFGARQLAEIDGLLEVHDRSVIGQANAIFGAAHMEVIELLVDLVTGLNPDTATGYMLRCHALLTGIEKRPASRSTVPVTLSLDAGITVQAGKLVSVEGNPTAQFALDADVVSTGAGDYPGTATAVVAGPTFAPAGTLTVIDTTVSGWTAVTNAADATVGLAEETDEELRQRRAETLVAQGGATLDAIVADLLGVDGVTDVNAYENTTNVPDGDGVPPHAFEAVAVGGSDADVAGAVWNAKAAGIQAHGNTTATVTDSQGFSHSVGFTRPAARRVYLSVAVLETTDGLPADTVAISEALVAATQGRSDPAYFAVGGSVYPVQLERVVVGVGNVKNAHVNASFLAIGAHDYNTGSAPLTVGTRERATLSAGDISYPVVP